MSESGFIAEGYARELVPDAQLSGAHRVFFIVAGALCGLPGFVLAAQVVHGMGLARARYAFIVGGLISGVLGALSAYSGAKTRMNLAMLADEAFGTQGGRVVKSVIALSLIGWVGVILSVLGATAGAAIHSLYGINVDSVWIAIATAVAVAGITLHGVRGLEQVGMVIAPLLLVLLAYTFYRGCPPGAVSIEQRSSSLSWSQFRRPLHHCLCQAIGNERAQSAGGFHDDAGSRLFPFRSQPGRCRFTPSPTRVFP